MLYPFLLHQFPLYSSFTEGCYRSVTQWTWAMLESSIFLIRYRVLLMLPFLNTFSSYTFQFRLSDHNSSLLSNFPASTMFLYSFFYHAHDFSHTNLVTSVSIHLLFHFIRGEVFSPFPAWLCDKDVSDSCVLKWCFISKP